MWTAPYRPQAIARRLHRNYPQAVLLGRRYRTIYLCQALLDRDLEYRRSDRPRRPVRSGRGLRHFCSPDLFRHSYVPISGRLEGFLQLIRARVLGQIMTLSPSRSRSRNRRRLSRHRTSTLTRPSFRARKRVSSRQRSDWSATSARNTPILIQLLLREFDSRVNLVLPACVAT